MFETLQKLHLNIKGSRWEWRAWAKTRRRTKKGRGSTMVSSSWITTKSLALPVQTIAISKLMQSTLLWGEKNPTWLLSSRSFQKEIDSFLRVCQETRPSFDCMVRKHVANGKHDALSTLMGQLKTSTTWRRRRRKRGEKRGERELLFLR